MCSNVICLKISEVRWGISPESQLSRFNFNEIEDGMAWESRIEFTMRCCKCVLSLQSGCAEHWDGLATSVSDLFLDVCD